MNHKDNQLIFDKSKPGKVGYSLPENDCLEISLENIIDSKFLRNCKLNLPELSEPEVVRHFTNLSSKNHHIDKGFYPLGSCTMKYNPKINDTVASLDNFKNLHPLFPVESVQGALELLYNLEELLNIITGMHSTTLQPSAGSQGEFAGILVIDKYHKSKGNKKKDIIIPESAHGTNPASVVLGGYNPVKVGTNSRGRVDVDELKTKVNEQTAGMMLTQPNTLGLFENEIIEISDIIHKVDGLMYMDGANLNALLGIVRPADMGFDITHINLHKTFSTPHGGGGPGAGPIAVIKKLSQFLPIPKITKSNNQYTLNYNFPNSIGSLHTFYGNFLVLVRAYCYILSLGGSGLKRMSKIAILNANFLKNKLIDKYDIPFPDGVMHEFVISAVRQKNRGIKALDIAKALLDYGYHSPTIYFPINIPEAMMIEPTESENKDTLESFSNCMIDIDERIDSNPESLTNAPTTTPVGRLNETKANRELDINYYKK